jgi:hypothetical protein
MYGATCYSDAPYAGEAVQQAENDCSSYAASHYANAPYGSSCVVYHVDFGAAEEYRNGRGLGAAGGRKSGVAYWTEPRKDDDEEEIKEVLKEIATSTKTVKLRKAISKYPELQLIEFEALLRPEIKIHPFEPKRRQKKNDDVDALMALGVL